MILELVAVMVHVILKKKTGGGSGEGAAPPPKEMMNDFGIGGCDGEFDI